VRTILDNQFDYVAEAFGNLKEGIDV